MSETKEPEMLGYLVILFTALPLAELALLIKIGGRIGALNTAAVVVLTGVAGALLAKTQGLAVLGEIGEAVNSGIMPGDEILNGLIILSGGILFLTPGFITDFAGFFMLVPAGRKVLKKWLERKLQAAADRSRGNIPAG